MWSGEIVEALSLIELCFEIDIAHVCQQLVNLLLISPMQSLSLTLKLRRSWLDVGMANAFVLNMLMESGLEFVAIVGSAFLNAEQKFVDDVVGKSIALTQVCRRRP